MINDSSSFCPISYLILPRVPPRLYVHMYLPTDFLFSYFSYFLFPPFSLSIESARQARALIDRYHLRTTFVSSLHQSFDACFSMEIQRCTKRPGEDTAGPWLPWRRPWGPKERLCTREISLDSRRCTSPAKMVTTKAVANSCWPAAIPTFKTT